jgi:MFS family permease
MAGVRADRWRRHKEVAGAGYALSAGCKLGLLATTGRWLPTTAILYADRLGKGLRTAPRDALISLSAPRHRLAEAFGVHRALDTVGALAGPVAAFTVLSIVPRAYDAVFVCSFCMAIVGLGILVFFVENRRDVATARATTYATAHDRGDPPTSIRSAFSLLRIRRFRTVVVCGGVVGLLTLSQSFVYLTMGRRADIGLRWFPLLFVGASLVYVVLAVPVGRLADRVGRARIFIAGQALLVLTYLVVALPDPGSAHLLAMFVFFGSYYAATDGVLAALVTDALPPSRRTAGLAVLTTIVTAAHGIGAVLFGLAWSRVGPQGALVWFVIGLLLAVALVTALFRRLEYDRITVSP